MRKLPQYVINKLKSTKNTKEQTSNLESHMMVSRARTPLTDDEYLDKLNLNTPGVTDVSIAVKHPRANRRNTDIDIMYVQQGYAKWIRSNTHYDINDHNFFFMGFSQPAIKCGICYDSKTEITRNENVEFITNDTPWLFWVNSDGKLYGQNGNNESSRIELAYSNCTDVSAIRGLWNKNKDYDYGLLLFFVMSGSLYYRQLINEEWTDAAPINFGPSKQISEISTTRTWDTRIVVQIKTIDGSVYSLFSQLQGFGKNDLGETIGDITITRNTFTYNLKGVVELPPCEHKAHNIGRVQCLEANICNCGSYDDSLMPVIKKAYNRSLSGNYGKRIYVELSDMSMLDAKCFTVAHTAFTLTDSRGFKYAPSKVIFKTNSSRFELEFTNFNSARGECVLEIKGSILEMPNGLFVEPCTYTFTPINLVPPQIPGPKPLSVDNNASGTELKITFDKPVYSSDISYNSSFFTVSAESVRPDRPDIPHTYIRKPFDVELDGRVVVLKFNNTNLDSIQNFNNHSSNINYAGGNLSGNENEDIVSPFDISFTPTGMSPKNDQCSVIHLITSVGDLQTLSYELKKVVELPPIESYNDNIGTIGVDSYSMVYELKHVDDV